MKGIRYRAEFKAEAIKQITERVDGLVFMGGIGEHSAQVRALICEQLEFLGFYLNEKANQSHLTVLITSSSKPVIIIPADEEAEIARLVTDISRN